MKIGVLALQGDFAAHARIVVSAGAQPVEVRTAEELDAVQGLIIPGGESTTLRIVARNAGLLDPLREKATAGLPIFGTCAGMIACARTIADGDEPILGVVDVTVRRNAFGRQVDSFEADIDVDGIGSMRAVFIRAPRVETVGMDVEVLARYRDEPVVVRQGPVLLTSFHPEIAGDDRLHRLFVEGIR